MQRQKRQLAFLAAMGVLAAGIPQEFAFYNNIADARVSVLSFAEALKGSAPACNREQVFSELRFSADSRRLCRDGTDIGDSCGGFAVRDGSLMVDTAAAGVEGGGFVTPEEAAELIGCEVYRQSGDVIVTAPFQTGTLIVKAKELHDRRGAVSCVEGYNDLHILQYDSPADAYSAYLAYSSDSSVQYAEPNRILRICDDGDSTGVSQEWGVQAIGSQPFLDELADRPGNHPEIRVAVIDTGIYPEHTMLKNRIADGGITFVTEDEGSIRDQHGHGTNCAGIVCSVTNENVKILPIKALYNSGYGEALDFYCAMLYAAEQNVDAVSMSIGGLGESPLLDEASALLAEKDIPVIAAAGNEAMDAKYSHPANYPDNITVSAIKQADETYELTSFSNYGEMIDFAAPGYRILCAEITSEDATVYKSGTSMATPFVAGVIAAILDYNPDYTNDEIYEILRRNALDIGDAGFDTQFGWGLVQLRNIEFPENTCKKPQPSLTPGVYTGVQTLTLRCSTANAKIYYTLDGSVPDPETGTLYDGTPIQIVGETTIRAAAFADSGSSRIWNGTYRIVSAVPAASPAPGTYHETPVNVTLSAENSDAVYYTLDGSEPGNGIGTRYTGSIPITGTTILKAVSVSGNAVSDMMYAEYDIGDTDWIKMCDIRGGVLVGYSGSRTELDLTDTALTEIADGAFAHNPVLRSVILPDTVTRIGKDAFRECGNLISVTANRITEIGDGAFCGCENLTDIRFEWENVRTIGAYAFCDVPINTPDESACLYLDSLEQIGESAFSGAGCATSLYAFRFSGAIPSGAFRAVGMPSPAGASRSPSFPGVVRMHRL